MNSDAQISILLIEDNRADAQLLRYKLEAVPGYSFYIRHAVRLKAGLEALAERSFDAALVDMRLPDSSGVDTVRRIHEAVRELPVIVLTGSLEENIALESVREGADDFFSKDGLDAARLARGIAFAVERARGRRRLLELERRLMHADRLVAIGQLAAGVAHEVNNPAAFVLANTAVLGEHIAKLRAAFATLRLHAHAPENAATAEFLDSVLERYEVQSTLRDADEIVRENLEGIDRICSVVRDLKGFVRENQDEVELVDLKEIVDAACNIAANEIRHRARLVKEMAPIPLIAADRARLGQVVVNLLVNAAHSIEEGKAAENEIRIDVGARGDRVILAVSDTGAGIPDELRDRIFEPFFTTKPRERGTGLGLSICADIVRQHGGEIRFSSVPGGGSRFEVLLPRQTGLAVREVEEPKLAPESEGRRARILIIDDEPMVRRSFHRMLEPRHELVEAVGGSEGLGILARDRAFDVIFCDLMMPQVDGIMVYEALREIGSPLLERIVFISGGAFTPRARSFLAAVGSLVLEKPIAPDTVRGVVDRLSGPSPIEMKKTA